MIDSTESKLATSLGQSHGGVSSFFGASVFGISSDFSPFHLATVFSASFNEKLLIFFVSYFDKRGFSQDGGGTRCFFVITQGIVTPPAESFGASDLPRMKFM